LPVFNQNPALKFLDVLKTTLHAFTTEFVKSLSSCPTLLDADSKQGRYDEISSGGREALVGETRSCVFVVD